MQRLGVILFLTAVLAGGVVPPVAFSRGGRFPSDFSKRHFFLFSEGHDLCRSVIIGFFAAPDFIAREYLPAFGGKTKVFWARGVPMTLKMMAPF